jgi:hypothetical protein
VIARHDTSTVNRLRPSHTLAPHIAVRQLYRHNLAHMCTHAPRPACAHTLHAHPQPEAGEVAGQRRGTCGDGGVHLSHCRERVFKGQSHSMHSSATHQWRLCASYCSTHTHTHTHTRTRTHTCTCCHCSASYAGARARYHQSAAAGHNCKRERGELPFRRTHIVPTHPPTARARAHDRAPMAQPWRVAPTRSLVCCVMRSTLRA